MLPVLGSLHWCIVLGHRVRHYWSSPSFQYDTIYLRCVWYCRRWCPNLDRVCPLSISVKCRLLMHRPRACALYACLGLGVGGNLPVDGALFLEFLPFASGNLLTMLSVWWPLGQLVSRYVILIYVLSPRLTSNQSVYSHGRSFRTTAAAAICLLVVMLLAERPVALSKATWGGDTCAIRWALSLSSCSFAASSSSIYTSRPSICLHAAVRAMLLLRFTALPTRTEPRPG